MHHFHSISCNLLNNIIRTFNSSRLKCGSRVLTKTETIAIPISTLNDMNHAQFVIECFSLSTPIALPMKFPFESIRFRIGGGARTTMNCRLYDIGGLIKGRRHIIKLIDEFDSRTNMELQCWLLVLSIFLFLSN